jgi:glycosyltransferase involved in cell wall biosynthesis
MTDANADPSALPASGTVARVLVDATGTLQTYTSAPTGIPRLEEAIVRAALADPDPAVAVVRFDRRRRKLRSLTSFEQRMLAAADGDIKGGRPIEKFSTILRQIGRNPTISRDADRHFADLATNSRRRGLRYAAAKLFFRSYRLLQLALLHLRTIGAADEAREIDGNGGVVLLSNAVLLGSRLSRALSVASHRAFICHDLIPIAHPEFAIDPDHASRFADNIEQILRAGCEVLCTSAASQAMLSGFMRTARIPDVPVSRFPMPSILRERTPDAFSTPSPEPFAIYCSTIEARKNHLLLARVWHRAIKEGVTFPRLVCVGKWGWGTDDLAAYLSAHPELRARIDFTGPIGDAELVEYYRRALFGVVPSHLEGWGYGASECMDFGLPVLVSTTPALREATGGLVPAIDPDDEDRWYAEIKRITEDGRWRAELRRTIVERHRATPTAASWMRIKQALLSPPRPHQQEASTGAPSGPPLSVVVTTRDPWRDVLPGLKRLPSSVRELGGELILISGAEGGEDFAGTIDGVRVHRMPGASIFQCRAAAPSLASSDIVALTEDHCVHGDDWCARIIENFANDPSLVLLGGAVENGSTKRIEDLMNFWTTFAPFSPGQVTARHPCVAHYAIRKSAMRMPLKPGELESTIIQTFEKIPGAVFVDPGLRVLHVQSHGFWNTFAVHYHNGRATAGFSARRRGNRNLSLLKSLRWTWSDTRAHLRRSGAAFMVGTKSATKTAGYLLLILPLVTAHAIGEFVGYRRGAGSSAERLV